MRCFAAYSAFSDTLMVLNHYETDISVCTGNMKQLFIDICEVLYLYNYCKKWGANNNEK